MKFKVLKFIISICCLVVISLIMPAADIIAEPEDIKPDTDLSKQENAAIYNKGEVIYATLIADGNVQDIYVVNHFDITRAGDITDYGNYTSVSNLTNTDQLVNTNNSVSFQASEGNFYYQGNMTMTNLPWIFDISYYLDGVETAPQDLAGKSGEVEICIATRQNKLINSAFYENYILQVTVTLDSEKCNAIEAPSATVADSGSDKIIVNTIMPEKDGNIKVSAKVNDFTMDGIEISAMPFTMEIETLDTGEMVDEMATLTDAISDLNDGVKELNDGVADMSEGANELADGSAEFNHGLWYLSNNSGQLTEASGKINKALKEIADSLNDSSAGIDLDDFAKLPDGLDQLSQGLNGISGGLTQLNDGFLAANNALDTAINEIPYISQAEIESLSGAPAIAELDENQKNTFEQLLTAYTAAQTVKVTYYGPNGNDGVKAAFDSVATGIDTISGSIDTISQTLSDISTEINSALDKLDFADQMQQLKDGMSMLSDNYGQFHSGLVDYTNGVKELSSNYIQLLNGLVSLSDGIVDLHEGTSELHEGTSELNDGVANLPEDIETEIDNFMKDYDKSDFKPISFVSEKNKNTSLVQFIFKADDINMEEETVAAKQESDKTTFWDRLLALFHINT